MFLSAQPAAQTYLARLEKKHAKGTAVTILAHKVARAVYDMLTRKGAFDAATVFQAAGRGADAPGLSLDNQGGNRLEALDTAACLASENAPAPRGPHTLRPLPLLGHPLSLLFYAALVAHGLRGLLLPRA